MVATVDVDAAVGAEVVVHDLATGPDGTAALVGNSSRGWLVAAPGGETTPVHPGSELVFADDGLPLVVGHAPALGGPPDAAVLDGDVLFLARDTRLAAVDPGTGAVRATATAPGPVTHLALLPDGGLAALVRTDGVALLRLTPDLRPDGHPIVAVPTGPATALEVTADGTAVVAAYVNEAQDAGQLVTVADGRVRTVAELEGTDDTALDVAVVSGSAYLALSASYHPAELTAVDLAPDEVTGVVTLCGGAAAFGALAPSADGGTLTVVGSCIDADPPRTTALVLGRP
ncbi:hypothetical protein [Geodermatophilus sp. SYSU D00710]